VDNARPFRWQLFNAIQGLQSSLRAGATLEIAADIPGFQNVPTSFALL
jgi:hypothetical protein